MFGRLASLISGCSLAAGLCAAAVAPPAVSTNDNRKPAGQLGSGVLTLRLEMREATWYPNASDPPRPGATGGIRTYAFAEEGHAAQIPAPLIRVPQGTEVRISVRNPLGVPLVVHGLHQHPGNAKDVMELAAGQSKEVRFTAGEPGSYLYWADFPDGRDDTTGLLSGAFVVDPPGTSAADRIFIIQLWARNLFHRDFSAALALNGKAWPYTERVQARVGQPEHWRVINATPISHPMHLHGFYFMVDAVGDGESEHHYADPERRMVVTENLGPHGTFDMTWKPERAGNWLFHCHILDHMSGYYSPVLFGPDGPEAAPYHGKSHGGEGMGMAKLVVGISVTDDAVRPTPVRAAMVSEQRHLFVRQRAARPYQPAGPGFYLEGVSREVEAIGPPLVITRGVRTAITVTNELQEPTAIHWHGLEIESYYDGVPGWAGSSQQTTPSIAPGSSFVAYMTPPRAGTFIYHTHWHDAGQLTGGLYGALIVLPPGEQFNPATDKVFVLGRGGPDELHDPLLLNGNPQPHTMVLLAGKSYRVRLINITPTDPEIEVSLRNGEHAAKWRALAKDGADLPASQATMKDAVQVISVGETYDFAFAPQEPGAYALRFCSDGNEVTQMVVVVPPNAPFSVFAREVAADQHNK